MPVELYPRVTCPTRQAQFHSVQFGDTHAAMADGEEQSSSRIFAGVQFAIIPSEDLEEPHSLKVRVPATAKHDATIQTLTIIACRISREEWS